MTNALSPNGKGGAHLPLFTRPQLAEIFGVNPGSISDWETEAPPLPVAEVGGPGKSTLYALPAVVAWWRARERARVTGAAGTLSKDTAQARQAEANTDRIRLDIARRRGELFDAGEALQAWSAMVAAFRARTLAIPRALAETLVHDAANGPSAVEAILMDALRDALAALADWHPATAASGSPTGKAAPRRHRQRP